MNPAMPHLRRAFAPWALTAALGLLQGVAGAETLSLCDATPRPVASGSPVSVGLNAGALPPGSTVESVVVDLDIEHDWLGDLRVELTHGATTVVLLHRPNLGLYPYGCGGRDLLASFRDDALTTPDDLCVATTPLPQPEPMLVGDLRPLDLLDAFSGQDPSGPWTLTVQDLGAYDAGTVRNVCVEVTYAPPPPACPDADGDGEVNFDDLNIILAAWGSAGPAGDVAPAGGNGVVDFDDLNAVLTAWGSACP